MSSGYIQVLVQEWRYKEHCEKGVGEFGNYETTFPQNTMCLF